MPQGFLAVSSQPSSQLPIKEFHAWYEEEHIPLRLNRFEEFLSGARYKEVSRRSHEDRSAETSWLALYTVTSPAIFSSSSYRNLRINRSDREKDVMSRIEVLTRITGEIIGTHLSGEDRKTTGFKPGRPSGWVVTHGINTRNTNGSIGESINSWASQIEQSIGKYRDIEEGWARTLLVLVLETGVSRYGRGVEADDNSMPYFVVHEFKDRESAEGFSKMISEFSEIGIVIGESTIWELYNTYPCLADVSSE